MLRRSQEISICMPPYELSMTISHRLIERGVPGHTLAPYLVTWLMLMRIAIVCVRVAPYSSRPFCNTSRRMFCALSVL